MLAAGGGAQAATAGMAEPHPHRRRVPRSLPAPPLPDNPKPTTRPRPRAPTGGRGKGRAPTAPPASAPPPLPRCGRELAASAGEAPEPAPLSGRLPACASLRPLRGPATARRSRFRLGVSGRLPAPPAGLAPRAPLLLPSRGRPAGCVARGQPRSQCLRPRAPAACLPVSVWASAGGGGLPGVPKGTACIVAVAGVSGAVSPATVRWQKGTELSLPRPSPGVVQGSTSVGLGVFHIRACLSVPH